MLNIEHISRKRFPKAVRLFSGCLFTADQPVRSNQFRPRTLQNSKVYLQAPFYHRCKRKSTVPLRYFNG